jgi:DNA repair photolyase
VDYRALATRSLMNHCTSPRVPFPWTVNPFRGCAMGCRYCYAAYTHEFLGLSGQDDFHTLVYVKQPDGPDTERALDRAVRRGELVALGTATDPYQPAEAEARVTRRFLEAVARRRGVRLALVTKGALVLRDLALLRRIHRTSRLTVNVSLVSTRDDLLRRLEPWAPSPETRLRVLGQLVGAGLDAGLSIAPVLPGLTDGEAVLDDLMRRAAAAGVRRVGWRFLFLRSPTREKFFRWLETDFPHLLPAYRRAFAGRSYLDGRYQRRVGALLERLRDRHGLIAASFEPPPAPGAGDRQLPLFPGGVQSRDSMGREPIPGGG